VARMLEGRPRFTAGGVLFGAFLGAAIPVGQERVSCPGSCRGWRSAWHPPPAPPVGGQAGRTPGDDRKAKEEGRAAMGQRVRGKVAPRGAKRRGVEESEGNGRATARHLDADEPARGGQAPIHADSRLRRVSATGRAVRRGVRRLTDSRLQEDR
jgi:hypothetical protein